MSYILRRILFILLLPVAIVTLLFIFIIFFLSNKRIARYMGKKICWILLLLIRVLGISYEVHGSLQYKQSIIASNHESFWETIAFFYLFDAPCFIVKKELLDIFFIRNVLNKVCVVPVARDGNIKSELDNFIRKLEEAKNEGINIVIFPQGTRVEPRSRRKFKNGIMHIAKNLALPITCVSMNSGDFNILKDEGTIKIHILEDKNFSSIEEIEKAILDKRDKLDF